VLLCPFWTVLAKRGRKPWGPWWEISLEKDESLSAKWGSSAIGTGWTMGKGAGETKSIGD